MTLRTKTILLLTTLMILLLAAAWWTQHSIIEQSLRHSILDGAESLARSTAGTIANFLDDKQRITRAIAESLTDEDLTSLKLEQVETKLQKMLTIFPVFENGMFVLTPEGKLWADYPPHPETRGRSFAFREYFIKTMAEQKGIVGEPYRSARTGQPVLTFTELLHDEQGQILGVLGCSVQLNSPNALGQFATEKFGQTGYVYVYSRSRLMIMHPRAERILQRDVPPGANRLFDAAIDGFEGVGETVNSRGVAMLLALAAVPGSDWIVGAQQPMREALAPLRQARLELGLIAMLGLGAALLTGLAVIRHIINPLKFLNQATAWLGRPVNDAEQTDSAAQDRLREELQRVSRSGDEIGALAKTFLDIDGRLKEYLTTLSNVASEWERTFDTVEDALFIVDSGRKVLRLNRAGAELVGRDYRGAIGEELHLLLFGDRLPLNASPLNWPPGERGTLRSETTLMPKEGEFEIAGTRLVEEGDTASGAIFVVRNITQRKLMEKNLRESSKLNALGTMASGIAHDFNNILSAIIGYTQILRQKLRDDSRPLHYLDEISKAGDRGAALIRSLMTYSRKDVQQASSVDLNGLLTGLESMLKRLAGEGVQVRLDLAGGQLLFWGHKGQLEQVIVNLVVNARDAMPDGGRIQIRSRVESGSRDENTPGVVLEVEDSGQGMKAEVADKIFDPFYTTKPIGKGTGLGLSIVQGIVHAHSGTISLTSASGQGTCFRILLPGSPELKSDQQLANPGQPGLPDELCILLVDDEPAVLEVAQTILEESGWHILSAKTGEAALQLFQQHQDTIDLLVTDVIMPAMNGPELAQRLGQIRPELPVVYLSGYTADILKDVDLPLSRSQVLGKPFTPDDLRRAISQALKSSA